MSLDDNTSQQQPVVIIDGRDCVYGVPLDPTTKRHLGGRARLHICTSERVAGNYDVPFRFDNNQLLLPLMESTSDVWLRQLRD